MLKDESLEPVALNCSERDLNIADTRGLERDPLEQLHEREEAEHDGRCDEEVLTSIVDHEGIRPAHTWRQSDDPAHFYP